MRTLLHAAMGAGLVLGLSLLSNRAEAERPATQPASAEPVVGDDAQKVLDQIKEAYGKLKSLQVTGTVNVHAVAAKTSSWDRNNDFTSSFMAPNLFRHELKGSVGVLVGDNGKQTYLYFPDGNWYSARPAPARRAAMDALGDHVSDVLRNTNLSLALAVCADPTRELLDGVDRVTKEADENIDVTPCETLKFLMEDTEATLWVDSRTHLLRREQIQDRGQGISDLKGTLMTIDFAATSDVPLKADNFAWAAPARAVEANGGEGFFAAFTPQLAGKPVPAFRLKLLSGGAISNVDLKGNAYVLVFWATAAPPSVDVLPILDKIYQDYQAAGLGVFAVNRLDDRPTIMKTMETQKITLPVLLDENGTATRAFQAAGLPEIVVIGKDGIVRNVFVGDGHETEVLREIKAAMGNWKGLRASDWW